jgi:excisionase family DNA binding protein
MHFEHSCPCSSPIQTDELLTRASVSVDSLDPNHLALLAEGLMTVTEAAKFLALSKSKLYLLMDAGKLPYFKEGKSRRIPRRALTVYAISKLRGGWNMEANDE